MAWWQCVCCVFLFLQSSEKKSSVHVQFIEHENVVVCENQDNDKDFRYWDKNLITEWRDANQFDDSPTVPQIIVWSNASEPIATPTFNSFHSDPILLQNPSESRKSRILRRPQ